MKRLSSLFYNDSYSYYKSALIISGSGYRKEDDQLLLTPILFLLRHAIELILKANIIDILEFNNQGILKCKLVTENGIKTNIKLLNCHSISNLFSYLIYLNTQYSLVSVFNDNELKFSYRLINDIEDVDSKSDYFRYPINKNTKAYKRKFIIRGDIGIAPEIKSTNFLFLFGSPNDECVVFSTKEKKYLELVKDMTSLYKILQKKWKTTKAK